MLTEGDQIVLGENIYCDTAAGSYQCTEEKLAELKGHYTYTDAGSNDYRVSDSYIVGY